SNVWRTATGRAVATLGHRPVQKGAFSPDGRLVATIGGEFAQASIFDAKSGRLMHLLPPKGVTTVRFAPRGGDLLATADYRGTDLWSPHTGRHIALLTD